MYIFIVYKYQSSYRVFNKQCSLFGDIFITSNYKKNRLWNLHLDPLRLQLTF
jgi:hypothetical protein